MGRDLALEDHAARKIGFGESFHFFFQRSAANKKQFDVLGKGARGAQYYLDALLGKEPGDGDEQQFVVFYGQLLPGFFSEFGRIFKGGKIAAASYGVVELLVAYAGLKRLVAHGVADGYDGVGNKGGLFFRGDIELVFKGALKFVEGQAVDGVDYFGFRFRVGGRQPSYDAGFGRVGVDYVEGIGAEIIFQVSVSLKIF